jgi:hypothetical protein
MVEINRFDHSQKNQAPTGKSGQDSQTVQASPDYGDCRVASAARRKAP